MRKEIDACTTVEELQRLWKSRPFQTEYERHPKDWQDAIVAHFNDAIELVKSRPPRVDPLGQIIGDQPQQSDSDEDSQGS